jgi:hypothetical protein
VQKTDEPQPDLVILDIGCASQEWDRGSHPDPTETAPLKNLSPESEREIQQASTAVGQADDLAKANAANELLDINAYTRRSLYLTRTEILARMSAVEPTQFGFWNRKLRDSACQANPKLREDPDGWFRQTIHPRKMNVYLCCKLTEIR